VNSVLERKKEASGKNKENWKKRTLKGYFFFFIIQNSPHLEKLKKLYMRRVLESLQFIQI